MKTIEQKEFEWKEKRRGKITASILPDLMTSGRAKDDMLGMKALAAMYITRYERRTGCVREQTYNKNFEWGHENESLAIEWLRNQFAFNTVKSCTTDFNDIIFNEPFEGYGDSPDFYVYDNDGNICAVGEIKCPVSQSKIEELLFLKAIDEKNEYYWQFLGHFVGKPDVEKLYYVIYDGYQNEGKIIEVYRKDHEANIQKLIERIRLCHEIIEVSLRLNLDFKECIDIAQKIMMLKLEIEMLKPQSKGDVPTLNKIYRIRKEIRKTYSSLN